MTGGSSSELMRLRGLNAGGASTLGGSGGVFPREILKFSFSKTHVNFSAISERINELK